MIFKPLMNQKEVLKRKLWQERVYGKLIENKTKKEIKVAGISLVILPGMFAPLWGDSLLLAKVLKKLVRKDDVVLDLGTGSGIQGIIAAKKAKSVISLDINPLAVKVAKINVKKNNLMSKIKVIQSNLFSQVKDKKFSLVVYNPPFRWFKPRNMLERGEVDYQYNSLNIFFKDLNNHLLPKGRAILVFSDSGDVRYLDVLIKKYHYHSEIIAKEKLNGWNYFVYEIKN